jgi:hypothetical protein
LLTMSILESAIFTSLETGYFTPLYFAVIEQKARGPRHGNLDYLAILENL